MATKGHGLSSNDWILVGEWIKAELERRRGNRRDREKLWAEIDRQIDMTPRAREVMMGEQTDWYPNIELPLQSQALEVTAADARRLKFPRGTEWYKSQSDVSDSYRNRWNERRETKPLIGDSATPVELDQETADVLVHATIDHFHKQYDFRQAIELFDSELIKYGTGVVRVRPVQLAQFRHDPRGTIAENTLGPAVLPLAIRNTYLDDSPGAVMHQGVGLVPSVIIPRWQDLEALKRAARKGGADRGWIMSQVNKLEIKHDPRDKRGQVEVIEFEGDVVVPKSRSSIFLPNVTITVAVHQGDARAIRFEKNPMSWRSYVVGHYMRDNVASPYGSSPLMKGQPLQEAATAAANDLLAVAALNARPPVAYDRHDAELAAMGGPEIYPGATWPTDAPNAIEPQEVGDPSALLNIYVGLLKQYEDVTGVNDPRRGAQVKSHTGTGAHELEASRGIARTDDFVTGVEQGPLTTMLYHEWEIIKKVMKSPRAINVDSGGIEGYAKVAAADLPDNVTFTVHGSAGVLNERERVQNFFGAVQFALQIVEASAAMGVPVPVNWMEVINHAFVLSGEQNASRFFGEAAAPTGVPGQPASRPGVPADGLGPAQNAAPAVGAGAGIQ